MTTKSKTNQIQKCPKCGIDVEVLGKTTLHYEPVDKSLIAPKNVTFHCTMCGAIKSPARALRDLVYVIPDPPHKAHDDGIIEIPQDYQEYYKTGTGTIISVGPGYRDAKGKFHPTTAKVGQRIHYDHNVPFGAVFIDSLGKEVRMQIIGERDIHFIYEDNDVTSK